MPQFNKNKKALSLIEMLIVLIIISTTVLTAFGIILRSNLEIKENEVKDTVNTLMVSINEAVKTPVRLQLRNFSSSSFSPNVEYAFRVEQQGSIYILTYVSGSTSLTSCSSTSSFKYNIASIQSTVTDVCVLVSIKSVQGAVPARYEVKTNTLYTFNQPSATPNYSYLIANRYDTFDYI